MKQVVWFLIISISLHVGHAIKCYNCISNATNDCRDYLNIPTIECPGKDQHQPVCIRRVLESSSGKSTTLQCIDTKTGNECNPPSVHYNVTDCEICQTDLCNGHAGISSSYNLVTLFCLSTALFLFILS